ncbi:MAG: hypothetical protein M1816_004241 [Peltula sp. TS41687]|nr:MAG: hypothetical protein M1816_004241 [Peltula sp. TS41687]
MKRHDVLLDWIEQQRRELVGDGVSAGRKGGQRRSKRVSSRALRSSLATEPTKTRARPRKLSMARCILHPVDPGKVTKTPNKRRSARLRTNVPRDVSQVAEKRISIPALPSIEVMRRSRSRTECSALFTCHESPSLPQIDRSDDGSVTPSCHRQGKRTSGPGKTLRTRGPRAGKLSGGRRGGAHGYQSGPRSVVPAPVED